MLRVGNDFSHTCIVRVRNIGKKKGRKKREVGENKEEGGDEPCCPQIRVVEHMDGEQWSAEDDVSSI
jgi:hypothetical protein